LPASTLVPVPRLTRDELLFEIAVTAVIPGS
jgi:enamine deaminase RidA (YjgF/YER057c/UK114 family)